MQKNRVAAITNEYLADQLILPGNVHGYLDWITGVLRLNCTGAEYEALGSIPEKQEERWASFFETYAHEMFHLLQIISSGYLYNYVTKLGYALLLNELDIENRLLSESISRPKPLSQKYIETASRINNRHGCGLAVIDLVEGAAFLAQQRMVSPNIRHDQYLSLLDLYDDTAYSRAYKYLYAKLGEKTFHIFPTIAYVSLGFSDPIRIFLLLSDEVCRHADGIYSENCIDIVSDMIDKVFVGDDTFGVLESPLNVYSKKDSFNPFYTYTLEHVSTHEEFENLSSYMCNPHWIPADFFLHATRPVLFNDATMLIPHTFSAGMFDTKGQHEDMLKAVLVASFQIAMIDNVGPSFFIPGQRPSSIVPAS